MDPNDEHVAPAHRIELDTASEDHDSGEEQDGISSEEDQAAEEGRPVDRGDLEGGEAPEIEPQRPEHLEPGDLRGWMRFRHARAIERLNSEQILHAMLGIHVARDNAELVEHLRDTSSLRSEEVAAAFQACPRGSFVPSEYSAQAYVETPIRIEALGFNISAPHMHAMCLERLDLRPGLRVLDVGCGCGAVTAMCAFLVRRPRPCVPPPLSPLPVVAEAPAALAPMFLPRRALCADPTFASHLSRGLEEGWRVTAGRFGPLAPSPPQKKRKKK
mmetsp:Transcript_40003/g.95043  ORF Transcript_40003/g.95043 Transcript_40003/m.95043 type:complete len:273 (+) Transcript_40003:127-945(+)